jgi:ABC-type multidrug transport system ATPase subunit
MKNPDEILCKTVNLTKSYGKKEVLKGCSLTVARGERIGLIGENGSGKSTFLKCLMGFTPPSRGIVELDGVIGYCPQDNFLNKKYTVSEHLKLAEAIYQNYTEVSEQYAQHLLSQFKLLPYMDTLIGNLSSGTFQKVKLVTSIYHSPDIVLLDEPYDGFDWRMYQVFWEVMEDMKTKNISVLMVSHFIYDFERFDRIFELKEGRLEQTR